MRREFSVHIKNHMCYYIVHAIFYVLMITCYIYHACSAPSNLKAQSYVDTMLVSILGLAAVQEITIMVAKEKGGQ
jgi:hypothetical protein